MKYIKVSYKNHSRIYNIMLLGISISITLGLIISLTLDKELISNIYNYFLNHISNYNNNTLSNILYPIIIYISIFILSLTLIGSFIPFLALFIENMSIGFILGILIRNIGLKGLLFGIIYFIFTKALYLIILIYLVINTYKFLNIFINSIKNKTNYSIYKLYSNIFIKIIFSILAITSYNFLGMLVIPRIIDLFTFLI